jgi:transcriptional regulator with XRE-family HTH domain
MRAELGPEFRRLRVDAGVSARALASAVGVHHSAICRFERGEQDVSIANLVALGIGIGSPAQIAFRPASGPPIRDRLQASRVEALLTFIDSDWRRFVELPVGRAALGGGVIDCVLAHPRERLLVAIESEGQIRRLEQTLRWAAQKAEALRTTGVATEIKRAGSLRIERVLLLASTHHNRSVVEEHKQTFAAAYPGRLMDAVAALEDPLIRFPGSTVLWVSADGSRPRLLRRSPVGVTLGR